MCGGPLSYTCGSSPTLYWAGSFTTRTARNNVRTRKANTIAFPKETVIKVTGGCHCGHITYDAEVDPATVRVCHCTDCQKLTGTAFRATITSLPKTFRLKSGTPTIFIKTAESGNKRAHAFCPECGTPIYSAAPEPNPSTYGLRVGGIDQRARFAPPARQIWCRSAFSWSMDLRAVEKSDRQ
jgi:hypothetical protein